ncbi:MAG TPA: hypothetical protein VK184_25910 [Nostocaceae cyanobacterium]|nr:hypothetical protein [Nostocaceae cyanobacterium]
MKSLLIKSTATLLFLLGGYTVQELVFPHQSISIAQSIWQQFSSKEGKFSILMPGKPKQGRQTITTLVGNVQLSVFAVERKQDNVQYAVTYSDFSPQYIEHIKKNNLVEEVLETGKISVLQNAKGKLISERRISLNGHVGRELKYTRPGNKIVRHRMYLVDKRLYQVIVQTDTKKENFLTMRIEGFFNSFTLLPR